MNEPKRLTADELENILYGVRIEDVDLLSGHIQALESNLVAAVTALEQAAKILSEPEIVWTAALSRTTLAARSINAKNILLVALARLRGGGALKGE